ncbi:MAG: hypothetical protein ACP5QT_01695 [Brevinematia bacterium]
MKSFSIFPYLFLPLTVRILEVKKVDFHYDFEMGIKFNLIIGNERFGEIYLLTNQEIDDDNYLFYKRLLDEITDTKFLRTLLKKKVHIQNRGFIGKDFHFEKSTGFSFEKSMKDFKLLADFVLNDGILKKFFDYFEIKEGDISLLEKKIYQLLVSPTVDIERYLFQLPDNKLQLLLNHILSKKIASVDMLASYIRNLKEGGEKIIRNLSSRVRKEVEEKVRSGRIFSTYRWAEEVSYIINRNLLVASRELDISLPFFQRFEFIRKAYEVAILRKQIERKSLSEWLIEFSKEKRNKVILSTPRKILVEALTFVDRKEIEEIFSGIISKNGIKLLIEDVEFAFQLSEEERFYSLLKIFRILREIYYEDMLSGLDFEVEVRKIIKSPLDLELVVDEIGFAKALFALKGLEKEYIEKIMNGILKKIYDDLIAGKIMIKEHYDSRIKEYRNSFLRTSLILKDEGRLSDF